MELVQDPKINKVYCLGRRDDPFAAILDAMKRKMLMSTMDTNDANINANATNTLQLLKDKIVALKASTSKDIDDNTNANANDTEVLSIETETNDENEKKRILKEMRQNVALIIHIAWPVNFQIPLRSFEEHIKGLHDLIQFSLDVEMPDPAVLMFCSSISTAMGEGNSNSNSDNNSTIIIPEKPIPNDDLKLTMDMGYARSKLVGEKLVSAARSSYNARAFTLRIGQVSGHSHHGLWNDTEMIPLIVRSALTVGALPDLGSDVLCSWLPVDQLALVIIEIGMARLNNSSNSNRKRKRESTDTDTDTDNNTRKRKIESTDSGTDNNTKDEGKDESKDEGKDEGKDEAKDEDRDESKDEPKNEPKDKQEDKQQDKNEDDTIYNISNPNTFTWQKFLTILQSQNLKFETKTLQEWLHLLQKSEQRGEEHTNPAIKLIDHYHHHQHSLNFNGRNWRMEMSRSLRDSETLRSVGEVGIVSNGVVLRYVRDWLERWT